MRQIDYIIVGQGICGTFLSYYLMQENQSVYVIDEYQNNSASRVASGVINPVTGRRIVKTWKIDEIMPFAFKAYEDISKTININSVIKEVSVLDIHPSKQMKESFEKRLNEQEHDYLRTCSNEDKWRNYFEFTFGISEISPAYTIDLTALLSNFRNHLIQLKCLSDDHFSESELQIKNDSVVYKNITAKKIFFCDGINSIQNSFFKHLPFALNKGEALIVSIPGLPQDYIYKQGFSIVPLQNDLFWIGSTYEWNFENDLPTNDFRIRVESYLKTFLKIPFIIKSHSAAIRPANTERRPFAGLHNTYKQIGILNGMGTKGCSLAPYYAKQLTQHILYNEPIDEEADLRRFGKII